MPLFVPFAVFLMNHAYVHSFTTDKVYESKTECMDVVTRAVASAMEKAPEGGQVIGGCLPLPEGTELPKAPKEAKKGPSSEI